MRETESQITSSKFLEIVSKKLYCIKKSTTATLHHFDDVL